MSRLLGDLRTHWRPRWIPPDHPVARLCDLCARRDLDRPHLVLAAGDPVISNFDILGFVLSPAGSCSWSWRPR